MKKFITIIYILLLITPFSAFSQTGENSAINKMMKIQQEFNRVMMAEMTSDLMNNPVVGWNSGGLVRTIFAICFIIAITQALSNPNPTGMVTEMAKLAFYSWLIIALLGGPTYQRFSFLSTPYDNSTSNSSLDVDIFNFAAYHADKVAENLFQAAGPQKLVQASDQNKIMTENFMNARKYCPPNDSSCLKKFLSKSKVNPEEAIQSLKEKKNSGIFSALTPDSVSLLGELALKMYSFFSDLSLVFFFILSWLVDVIRSAINMFVMITFGIITGVSFFFMKIIFPFAIIPKYRDKVGRAFKVPLSATLYGLTTSVIVYVSAVGYTAMNTAATTIILNELANGGGNNLALYYYPIMFSTMTGMLVFSLLQIYAITKIPKLSLDLLSLSFESFVNFAQEAVSAGVGIAAKLGAAVATGGVALAGGAMGGAAGSMLGKGIGSITGGLSAIGARFGFKPSQNLQNSNFNSASGLKNGPKPEVSSSTTGMEMAQSSAVAPVSTSAVAESISKENLPGPKVKDPDKKVRNFTKKTNEIVSKGLSPNASPSDRSKALSQILGPRQKKESMLGNFLSASMKLGVGDSSEMSSLINDGVKSSTDSVTNFIDDTSERISNPEAIAERKEKIREAKINAGLDPDDPNDPDNMSFLGKMKSKVQKNSFYQNVKGSHVKTKEKVSNMLGMASSLYGDNSVSSESTQRTEVIQSNLNLATQKNNMSLNEKAIEKINSSENLNSSQVDELIKYKNNFNLDDKSNKVVESKLNKEISKSVENINNGSGTEEDFSLAYRAQNIDFKDPSQKINAEELTKTNEEFKKYSELKNEQHKKILEDLKNSDVETKNGADSLDKAARLMESGYISEKDYKETVSNKAEEFNQYQEEQRKVLEKREMELLEKQKEKQEKLIQKLKMGDDGLVFSHENEKYEFGLDKNKISNKVFLKNGEVTDKFEELNKDFINTLSQQVESINKQITAYNNSSSDFKTVSHERYSQLRKNLSIIEQIVEIYKNKDKNNK